MTGPPRLQIPVKTVIAIVLVVVAALVAESWIGAELGDRGVERRYALDVARLFALPPGAVLAWLLVREHRGLLAGLFPFAALTPRLVMSAILIGLLARIAWWSQATARGAFGLTSAAPVDIGQGLQIGFDCPPAQALAVAIVVWCVLVPVTEEFVHRGLLQSAFVHRGPLVAIGVSTIIFTIFHKPATWPVAFLMGLLFGVLYWRTRSLWAPLLVHATYDGLIILDWTCTRIRWRPAADELPLVGTGLAAIAVTLVSIAVILGILVYSGAGQRAAARPAPGSQRAGYPLDDV